MLSLPVVKEWLEEDIPGLYVSMELATTTGNCWGDRNTSYAEGTKVEDRLESLPCRIKGYAKA
jgi:hypothetical protein